MFIAYCGAWFFLCMFCGALSQDNEHAFWLGFVIGFVIGFAILAGIIMTNPSKYI